MNLVGFVFSKEIGAFLKHWRYLSFYQIGRFPVIEINGFALTNRKLSRDCVKKTFVLGLLVLVSPILLCAQRSTVDKTPREKEVIKMNKVKALNISMHSVIDGVPYNPGMKYAYEKYDTNGNMVAYSSVGGNQWYFKFDERGNRTEGVSLMFTTGMEDPCTRLNEVVAFSTVSSGENADTVVYKWEYQFDERNNQTAIIKYDCDGGVEWQRTMRYNEGDDLVATVRNGWTDSIAYIHKSRGEVEKQFYWKEKGEVYKKGYCKYDESGNLTEETILELNLRYDGDSVVTFKRTQEYDSLNHAIYIKEIRYNVWAHKKRSFTTKEFTYDQHGSETGWAEYNAKGKVMFKQTHSYKYAPSGLVIEKSTYDDKGRFVTFYKYEYEYYEK